MQNSHLKYILDVSAETKLNTSLMLFFCKRATNIYIDSTIVTNRKLLGVMVHSKIYNSVSKSKNIHNLSVVFFSFVSLVIYFSVSVVRKHFDKFAIKVNAFTN